VVIDANVLVALVDTRDKWHAQAVILRDTLIAERARLVYFDCVVNEAVGVIGRRAEEQKRSDQIDHLLDRLKQQVPAESITWVGSDSERLYEQVLDMCRAHGGRLNFNDILMALVCRERKIRVIASFDTDFDELPWLVRVHDLSGLQGMETTVA
jgi:predicted nucleic acid-binding protein